MLLWRKVFPHFQDTYVATNFLHTSKIFGLFKNYFASVLRNSIKYSNSYLQKSFCQILTYFDGWRKTTANITGAWHWWTSSSYCWLAPAWQFRINSTYRPKGKNKYQFYQSINLSLCYSINISIYQTLMNYLLHGVQKILPNTKVKKTLWDK